MPKLFYGLFLVCLPCYGGSAGLDICFLPFTIEHEAPQPGQQKWNCYPQLPPATPSYPATPLSHTLATPATRYPATPLPRYMVFWTKLMNRVIWLFGIWQEVGTAKLQFTTATCQRSGSPDYRLTSALCQIQQACMIHLQPLTYLMTC